MHPINDSAKAFDLIFFVSSAGCTKYLCEMRALSLEMPVRATDCRPERFEIDKIKIITKQAFIK